MRRRVDAANAQIGDLAGVLPIRFWGDETPGDVDFKISQLNDDIQLAKDERFGERGWQHRIDEQQAAIDRARALYSGILPENPTTAFYKLAPHEAESMAPLVPERWINRHKFETADKNRRRGRVLAWKRNQLAERLQESGIPASALGDAVMAVYPGTQQ